MMQTAKPGASSHQKFESIQALRGFAALYVFLFHAKDALPLWSHSATDRLTGVMNRGFMGVDIFFVISGFIMAWVCVLSRERIESPWAFAIKRFFRIVPPYVLSTLLATYLLIQVGSWEMFWKSVLMYPIDGARPPQFGEPLNLIGWTLNYEALFYAIFCIALFARRLSLVIALGAIAALVWAVPLLVGALLSLDPYRSALFSTAYARMATNPLILEFGLGILCAIAFHRLRGRVPKRVIWIALGLACAVMAWRMVAHPTGHSVVGIGLPAAALLLAIALADAAGLYKVPRLAVWLGEISFSIYLVHAVIILIVRAKMPPAVGEIGQYGKLAADLGLLLIVSYYWHRWIEAPAADAGMRLAKRFASRSTATPITAGHYRTAT